MPLIDLKNLGFGNYRPYIIGFIGFIVYVIITTIDMLVLGSPYMGLISVGGFMLMILIMLYACIDSWYESSYNVRR